MTGLRMPTCHFPRGVRSAANALTGRLIGLLVYMVALSIPSAVRAQSDGSALQPGLALGGSVGISGFGGDGNGEISSGVGWEAHLGYTLASGIHASAGVVLSKHDLAVDAAPWQLVSFFVEPRYFILGLSPTFAPFIAARAARVSEKVPGRSYELNATGTAFGAGGGVTLRVARQIALEAGLEFGRTKFDAYSFAGDFAWKSCLDGLEAGTPLPRSVSECSGSRSVGGVLNLCYPPYFPERTSTCSPPEIPYDGTGRSGTWTRAWIGVSLALSGGS